MNFQGNRDNRQQVQKVMGSSMAAKSAEPSGEKAPISPLGWSIGSRLLCALAASALLWLAVAWAMGWLQ
jgi:hypothetical protein